VCTLIALHQVHRDFPLVIAANRDELYARRATPPHLLASDPPIVGGRDEEKGGTWLGAAAGGFFVALTNQRTVAPPPHGARSRGEVVLEALAQPNLEAAVAWLARLDTRAYSAFNLMLGDARALWVAYARGDAPVELAPLGPGIFALPNDRLGSVDFPKVDRAALLAEPLQALAWPELVPAAQAMLADHDIPPAAQGDARQALCVHTPIYGTVSASLLAYADGAGLVHYHHADGPPCRAPLIARPALVEALRPTRTAG
jgi:uncharacterized protein with NRDE domain